MLNIPPEAAEGCGSGTDPEGERQNLRRQGFNWSSDVSISVVRSLFSHSLTRTTDFISGDSDLMKFFLNLNVYSVSELLYFWFI